jgi:hypothetical protein
MPKIDKVHQFHINIKFSPLIIRVLVYLISIVKRLHNLITLKNKILFTIVKLVNNC